MEVAAQTQVDLFAENLPSIGQIKEISNQIHSSEANMLAFVQKLEQNLSQTGSKAALVNGIGLLIAGKYNQAARKTRKGQRLPGKILFPCPGTAKNRPVRKGHRIHSINVSISRRNP